MNNVFKRKTDAKQVAAFVAQYIEDKTVHPLQWYADKLNVSRQAFHGFVQIERDKRKKVILIRIEEKLDKHILDLTTAHTDINLEQIGRDNVSDWAQKGNIDTIPTNQEENNT